MRRASCLLLLAGVVGAVAAHAETFPQRQVNVAVAYAAGGAADVIVRAVVNQLSSRWDKPIVVENKSGGGTQIAADFVAKSKPDGHTLLATGMETFAISPYIYSKLSYDVNDFAPVSGLGYSNQMLVVPASSPFKTIADVIAKAKEDGGSLQYGTIGLGGSSHINMVLFEQLAGIKLTPVHYRGGAPMLNDLLGNHVPMGFLSVTLVDQQIKAGQLRVLGVSSKERLPQFPDVPAINETVKGYEAVSWFGLFAPSKTPKETVSAINADFQKVFADPEFQKNFLAKNFLGTIPGDPNQFANYIKAESDKWSHVIKAANLKVEQ